MDRFAGDISISFKGRGDVVTDVDLECERVILELLAEEYPGFGILSEESEPVDTGISLHMGHRSAGRHPQLLRGHCSLLSGSGFGPRAPAGGGSDLRPGA